MKKKLIAYYRCSTRDQHYGIDVQKNQLRDWLKKNEDSYTLEAEFVENHSGSDRKRIELAKAINYCTENGATLIFTKLDRLSRIASHLHQIRDSGLDLICLDMPELNTLTFGIFATLAQYERELVSIRTRSALKIARQTKTLGNPNKWIHNGAKALRTKALNKKNWLESNEIAKAKQIIKLTNSKGHASLREIASNLNIQGIRTLRGKLWQANQVKLLLNSLNQ